MTLKRIKLAALLMLVVVLALVAAKAGLHPTNGRLLGMFDGDG